jgi:Response regulator containing CheY-like receiver domain and AraC-type DNA-binding domain
MYSLFLVEDEALELEMLERHIPWAEMDFRVVGSARNGRRAWEQIRQLVPDVVLTDVRMPIMDGLRLATMIRERFDGMKVVFLSGHDEFAYVKSAIESGAAGYLLKPVDTRELTAVMAKVKEEVDKAKLLSRASRLWEDAQWEKTVLGRDESERERALAELVKIHPSFGESLFESGIIVLDRSGEAQPAEHEPFKALLRDALDACGAEGMAACTGPDEWFVAVCATGVPDDDSLWHRLLDQVKTAWGSTATVGLCGRKLPLSEAPAMLREARRAVEERFYLGSGRIYRASGTAQPPTEGSWEETLAAFSAMIRPDRLKEALEHADSTFDRMAHCRVPRNALVARLTASLRELHDELAKYDDWKTRGAGVADEWESIVSRLGTLEDIKRHLTGLLRAADDFLMEKQKDRHERIVQEVVDILETQYMEALSVEYLAGKVYLSPNYLRWLFKEKKGCTVHEYLTRVRMNKALELLGDRSLKIKDVAGRVGYDNTSYFCSIFSRTLGVTPNEYRNKYL